MGLIACIKAIRPRQWVKNALVFAPLIFAQKLAHGELLGRSLLAFFSFCCLASMVYLWNDLWDRERDRLHPEKRHRPIAAGHISVPLAVSMALILGIVGFSLGAMLGLRYLFFPGVYLLINLAYSIKLKQLVIVDAMCISCGFLIRVIAGGEAIGVQSSSWLILCTLFVSLLLAFLKRRAELKTLDAAAGDHRESLRDYDPAFLDGLIGPLAALTVMAYALYTVDSETMLKFGSPENPRNRDLLLTVPFVIYGIFRYLFLSRRENQGGDPTRTLLGDRAILINGLLWLLACWLVVNGWGPKI